MSWRRNICTCLSRKLSHQRSASSTCMHVPTVCLSVRMESKQGWAAAVFCWACSKSTVSQGTDTPIMLVLLYLRFRELRDPQDFYVLLFEACSFPRHCDIVPRPVPTFFKAYLTHSLTLLWARPLSPSLSLSRRRKVSSRNGALARSTTTRAIYPPAFPSAHSHIVLVRLGKPRLKLQCQIIQG